jgi:hypothetical protein
MHAGLRLVFVSGRLGLHVKVNVQQGRDSGSLGCSVSCLAVLYHLDLTCDGQIALALPRWRGNS